MFYVYVLQSLKDRQLYVGYSENVHKRFEEHQSGKVKSTASRRPFRLIFFEAYTHSVDAKRREDYLKTTKGKVALRLMLHMTLAS